MTLGIRYLMRRSVAAEIGDRSVPEWPPHPGRVFMALVAAHFEAPQPDPAERAALEWMEGQDPPRLSAGPSEPRSAVETYVPANDTPGGISNRPRTPRTFASAYVGDEPVYLNWTGEPAAAHAAALEGLCRRVTRIGHSSSPVQMWVGSGHGTYNWRPAAHGPTLRIATPGTVAGLQTSFGAGVRPHLAGWQPYSESAEPASGAVSGPFEPAIVIFARRQGTRLGLEATLALTGALRNAAMNASREQRPPEWLTGHTPTGAPSGKAHAAFFPLPHVGHERADGHLLGVAMAVPSGVAEDELAAVLGSLLFEPKDGAVRAIRLWAPPRAERGGQAPYWEWTVELECSRLAPRALTAGAWVKPAKTWKSVTPVVLHHYPKENRGGAERVVREAFVSAGLPEPCALELSPAPWAAGALHVRAMPAFTEGGSGLCRYQVHVRARFAAAVTGPVLVGRGRFRGYGLFQPAPGEDRRP